MEDNLVGGRVNERRFWSKVDKNGPIVRPELGPCWIWRGLTKQGYGVFSVNVLSPRGLASRPELAHRISFELAEGPPLPGLYVLHACDMPTCVNDAHLRAGTSKQNAADRADRRRGWRQQLKRYAPPAEIARIKGHGEMHFNAKLTDEQIRELRTAYAVGTERLSQLARRFGISDVHVINIVTGKSRRGAGGPVSTRRRAVGTTPRLTPASVTDIRRRYAPGGRGGDSGRLLAEEYGVSFQTISDVIRARYWKHVVIS